MKEFQSCKTDAKVIFNNTLRSARNPHRVRILSSKSPLVNSYEKNGPKT